MDRNNTAVLLLLFNRPDHTKQLIDALRLVRPQRLFISCDGPRLHKEGEDLLTEATRRVINEIDWECTITKRFLEKNHGCKIAVSSGIDWFFSIVDEGIILEDDCIPSVSFFDLASYLLDRFRDDKRIGQISGFNGLGEISRRESYIFSNFGSVWGWATWARAWKYYDVNMSEWPQIKKKNLRQVMCNSAEYKKRIGEFQRTFDGDLDTWDYQWIYTRLVQRMLVVIPAKNLIRNIGQDETGTHINADLGLGTEIYSLGENIVDNIHYVPDMEFQSKLFFRKSSLRARLDRKLRSLKSRWAK